ncbi:MULTISPECIES: SRPBCC family protein [Enterococcus]|uniref:SRPBCC family protein n=1 Tax=Enterococcus TaxID=1350 RepID=UPI0008A17E5E|nr:MULTISPECIES: SRPBCC family protein [Enterococcus]EGP4760083.1 polyketide cyclase [Enterococcus faecium]OFK96318.1 polyketide cyclase [Enterococcus sp. HMSC063H10]
MTTERIEAIFHADIEKVWQVVTSMTNTKWRSDLNKVEVLEDQKVFVEYTTQDFSTTFTITEFEPMKFYAFEMENVNMKGKWTGEFFSLSDHKTKIHFAEAIQAKKIYLRPFVKSYLKKQQKTYVNDLTKYLHESF